MAYRILSLDGGGSWALIQVKCLQKLYPQCKSGHEILKHFDLVAANSGGSIVAAALAENLLLEDIINLFFEENIRRKIFASLKKQNLLMRLFYKFGYGPRYDTSAKRRGLKEQLPTISECLLENLPNSIAQKRDGDSEPKHLTHFLISAFDYDRNRATFFRSNLNSGTSSQAIQQRNNIVSTTINQSPPNTTTLLDAIHASSNAPINYFEKPAIVNICGRKHNFWDGAVGGYNNPILAAVIEAITNDVKRSDIRILSIGNGAKVLPAYNHEEFSTRLKGCVEKAEKKGLKLFLGDIDRVSKSILYEPPDAATFAAFAILNPDLDNKKPQSLVRFNPVIQPNWANDKWDVPKSLSESKFKRLLDLELDAVQQEDIDLIDSFCQKWFEGKVPNQPIKSNAQLEPLLGQDTFTAAKAVWK